MSGDTLTTLGKLLPTLLTLLILALCFIRGLMRGFRKSSILLIHYAIGLVVGFILYSPIYKMLMTSDLNWIFSKLSFLGDFSEAHSFYDVAKILAEKFLPIISGAVENPNIQQVITSIAGIVVSLVTGIVSLIIIPIVVRFILYLGYLLFLREGKHKRHKLAEGEDYRRRRLLGGIVGLIKGSAKTVLLVSFVTSIMFIISGGISKTDEEIEDLDLLEQLSDEVGVDLNAIYRGVLQSRNTGVGMVFDKIKIKGKPIDLFYSDYFLSSKFTVYKNNNAENQYLSDEEILEGELAEFYLREELTLFVKLFTEIYQSGVYQVVDGNIIIDEEILQGHVSELIDEFINNSVILNEITPLTIIGLAESINQGKLDIGEMNELFDAETVEQIRELDIAGDISRILKLCVDSIDILPVNEETGEIDFDAFKDVNIYLSFDVEGVKELFTALSEITLITKVLCPMSIGYSLKTMGDQIASAGIDKTQLDFSNIQWDKEIALIGTIYECAVNLDLDLSRLMDTEKDESKVPGWLNYLIELSTTDETSVEFKQDLLTLIDTIFGSDLYSQVALVAMKSKIAELSFTHEDGSSSVLNESLDLVKENLKHYTKEHLRLDLHELISSCLEGSALVPLFLGEIDPFAILYDMDTVALRKALLGTLNEETGEYEGGIYHLSLLNGDLNRDGETDEGCYFATDRIIETTLITYGSSILSQSVVDSVTKVNDPTSPDYDFDAWPDELDALICAIEELQTIECLKDIKLELPEDGDIKDILPKALTYADVDVITLAATKSVLLSGLIKDKLVNTLKENDQIGYAVEDSSIVWMDTVKDEGIIHGELNNLLKAFIIFSDEEKGFDLNDENSLINGLASLIHEATPEDLSSPNKSNILYGLDYEEAIYFAKSQVLMTVISKEVSNLGGSESGEGLALVIPSELDTTVNASNWKNWAHNGESSLDYKKGEFSKLALILYYAREYALLDFNSEAQDYPLTMDNLLNSAIYMEKDEHVVGSMILYATISDTLVKESEKQNALLAVPTLALVDNPQANNNIMISKTEIMNMFDVVREIEIDLASSDFSNIKLKAIMEKIEDDETRKSICVSKIFTASAINKLGGTSDIVIPREYQKYDDHNQLVTDINNSVWYPVNDDLWDQSELNKILVSVIDLNIEIDDNDNVITPSDDDLISSLTNTSSYGGTILDNIYESKIFRTTISSKILEREDVLHRTDALVEESFKVTNDRYTNIRKEEIEKLVLFLDESGLTLSSGFGTELIVEKLGQERVRELISTSNILNITLVSKLDEAQDITIPKHLQDNGKVDVNGAWYPVNDGDWEASEVAKILATVVELDIPVVDGTLSFPNEPTELLKDLNNDSLTQAGTTRLNVVYSSEVLKATIKSKIEEQETNGNISIREEAYVENDPNNYLVYDEIELLVEFANVKNEDGSDANIDLNNIKTKTVFELLGVERNREIITISNILNITVVKRFDSVEMLSYPEKFLNNEQKVNPNASDWYPSGNWEVCELAKLLASVHELELANHVDAETDEVTSPNTNDLLKNLNADSLTQSGTTRLGVVYSSEVLQTTITSKIEEQERNGNVSIREEAYVDKNRNNNLEYEEIELLVEFTNSKTEDDSDAGIDINNIKTKAIFELLGVERNREIIAVSNILNITVVKRFDDIEMLSFPSEFLISEDNPSTSENEQKVNPNASAWYPSGNWEVCELAKLLASVHELELANHVDAETDEVTSPNTNDLLRNLNADSLTQSGTTRLDVVYSSEIISLTINKKIKDVEEIVVRQAAYEKVNGVYTDRIDVYEISQLVEFVNFTNINIDNHELDAEHIFNILRDITPYNSEFTRGQYLRKMIVISNILNGTTVDKIGGKGVLPNDYKIKFASAYLNEDGSVNKEFAAWYPTTEADYNKCELYHMLVSVDELGIEAFGNEISLSIDENIDMLLDTETHNGEPGEKIIDVVYHSDNIAMTICDRLNESSIPTPKKTHYGVDIYDDTDTRSLSDMIIIEEEVEYLLEGVFSLGLEFHVEDDPNHEFDYAHIFDNIGLQVLEDNIDVVIESSILHYMISGNLIDQEQVINGKGYSIVTFTTWTNATTEKEIAFVNDTCEYIYKEEIINALEVLHILGIQSVHDASNINLDYLKNYFGTGSTNREQIIKEVIESAIMSKIFSQLLVSNNILKGIEFTSGVKYQLKSVKEVKDGEVVEILTLADLNRILIDNASAFDLLS